MEEFTRQLLAGIMTVATLSRHVYILTGDRIIVHNRPAVVIWTWFYGVFSKKPTVLCREDVNQSLLVDHKCR